MEKMTKGGIKENWRDCKDWNEPSEVGLLGDDFGEDDFLAFYQGS